MIILPISIDFARNVFSVHGANGGRQGRPGAPSVLRVKFYALITTLPPCVIGMEACSGAHR